MRSKLRHVTRTLRGKLSLWYLTSVGLIIAIFLTAVGILFWVTLQDQIDHHVHITVNEAREIVENYRGEERDELLKTLVSAQGMTIIVLFPDGAPVLETNSPDVALVTEHQLQKILTSSSLDESAPVHFTESSIRFAALPVQISAGKGILAVGYSAQVLYASFSKILLIVAGIVTLLVLPITFIGYRFLKKQLQPLESIASQAKEVSDSSSLSKRITIVCATEELTTIQASLNSMLSQLQQVFASERRFFSDAAHTLKTPLAILRSQIENLTSGQTGGALTQDARHELLTTIDTASDTIQDLLFLSKVGNKAQIPQQFSLTKMLQDLTELTSTLGEDKGLKVTADIQDEVLFKADKKLLQRALSNTVHNAVLYNRYQGKIYISLKKQSAKIVISISDTGLGVTNRDQAKIFTRFFRGENTVGQGSGLGLAITKAVVEDLDGQIRFLSKVNQGSTVTITFSS